MRKTENLTKGFSGLAVYDTESEKLVFQHHADRYFTPASNTKIFTLFTGLKILEDSIVTFLYTEKNDSLIFTATGDPALFNPKFPEADYPDFLKNSDKKLFYQSSKWKDEQYGAGWAWDDFDYSFSAQRSAMPIFGNMVHFRFDDKKNILITEPSFFQDSIKFQKTSGIKRIPNSNTFLVPEYISGEFSKNAPFQTSEALSIQLLEEKINKDIEVIHSNFELDQKIYSLPSDSLYREMMHESDNFIAEQILLMSSLAISDTLNSNIAIDFMQNSYFKKIPNKIFWVDGSGLSRYNLATPNSIVEILKMILAEENFEGLKQIFPALGRDGTVKNLLVNEATFAYAKSGSLRNNYSLSGFLISEKGKLMIFSLMNSNYTIPLEDLKDEIEKLLIQIRNKY